MDIDIVLDSHLPSEQLTELGLLAEQYGIHTLWNASYLDGRDPFSNLADLARQSTRLKIAPMALNAYEMHPFRIAMALLTLNEIADGRVETMIGGGGEVVMALGIPFEKRVRYVRECIEVVTGATRNRPFSYAGELFKIDNYDPQWPTAAPPFIYAGANKPQMLHMAAKSADGIFMSDLSLGLSRNAIEAVHARQKEIGRDPAGFRFNNFMAWYVYDDPAEARHEAKRWIGFRALFRDPRFRRLAIREARKNFRLNDIWKEAVALLPELRPADLARSFAGNRAQLIRRDGSLVDDFLVRETDHCVHVLNAVSPGLTGSLPFGQWVAGLAMARLDGMPA